MTSATDTCARMTHNSLKGHTQGNIACAKCARCGVLLHLPSLTWGEGSLLPESEICEKSESALTSLAILSMNWKMTTRNRKSPTYLGGTRKRLIRSPLLLLPSSHTTTHHNNNTKQHNITQQHTTRHTQQHTTTNNKTQTKHNKNTTKTQQNTTTHNTQHAHTHTPTHPPPDY